MRYSTRNCRTNTTGKCALAASMTAVLAFWTSPAFSDPVSYEGTATLCFTGGSPPSIERDDQSGLTYVSNIVSLYYIRTSPVAADSSHEGLINGWELLISDMESSTNMYRLKWTGVLIPTAYAGKTDTALEEIASIKTTDLSTLSGTWQGTGELSGTSVDYLLVLDSDTPADCPSEQPSQCADIEGGCMQAQEPFVYRLSGSVRRR